VGVISGVEYQSGERKGDWKSGGGMVRRQEEINEKINYK